MRVNVFLISFLLTILFQRFSEARGIVRRKKLLDQFTDYEASGDYFEVTVNNYEQESLSGATTRKVSSSSSSDDEVSADDGVTCSQSNVMAILAGYELENHVLVIFKVNVSANERELVLFLNLAKRFSDTPSLFLDHKFIVATSDHSSDTVLDFIEKEGYPADIVVLDEDEFPDLGFVTDLDELHVFIVDQCGRLAYIVVPPWSSAQHPYVKAALISAIIDFPCGCPSTEFASNINELPPDNQTDPNSVEETASTQSSTFETSTEDTTFMSNVPVIDLDTDEVENIEDLLDGSNSLTNSQRDNSEMLLPLRIVIPSVHMHFDNKTQNYWKYEQIVLKTDNATYHDHLSQGEMLVEFQDERWNLVNITSNNAKIFVGNKSLHDIQSTAKVDKIFIDRVGKSFKIQSELIGGENVYEMIPIDFDIEKVTPFQQIFGVRHHYEQLNRWLMFKI